MNRDDTRKKPHCCSPLLLPIPTTATIPAKLTRSPVIFLLPNKALPIIHWSRGDIESRVECWVSLPHAKP